MKVSTKAKRDYEGEYWKQELKDEILRTESWLVQGKFIASHEQILIIPIYLSDDITYILSINGSRLTLTKVVLGKDTIVALQQYHFQEGELYHFKFGVDRFYGDSSTAHIKDGTPYAFATIWPFHQEEPEGTKDDPTIIEHLSTKGD